MKIMEYLIFSHAMLAVGYSDHSKSFIIRNSWGEDWVMLLIVVDKVYKLCFVIG